MGIFDRIKGLAGRGGLSEPSPFTAAWCSKYLHKLESQGVFTRASMEWDFRFSDPNHDNLNRMLWKLGEHDLSGDIRDGALTVTVKEDLHGQRLARLVLFLDELRQDCDVFRFEKAELREPPVIIGFPGLDFKQRLMNAEHGQAWVTGNRALKRSSCLSGFTHYVRLRTTAQMPSDQNRMMELHTFLRTGETVLRFEQVLHQELGNLLFVGGMISSEGLENLYLVSTSKGEAAIEEELKNSMPWQTFEVRVGSDAAKAANSLLDQLG